MRYYEWNGNLYRVDPITEEVEVCEGYTWVTSSIFKDELALTENGAIETSEHFR